MEVIQHNLADMIKAKRNKVNENFPVDQNKKKILFLRYEKKKGVGNQKLQLSFLRNLERFAERAEIIDDW